LTRSDTENHETLPGKAPSEKGARPAHPANALSREHQRAWASASKDRVKEGKGPKDSSAYVRALEEGSCRKDTWEG